MAPEWLKSAVVVLATSATTAQAGWYLDKSCYANSGMIQKSMSSAFDLAKAGDTVLDRVTSKPDPSWTAAQKLTQKAELDLVTYVFQELLKDKDTVDGTSVEYRDARFTLNGVLKFAGFKGLALSANVETVDKQIAKTENKPYKPPAPPPSGVNTVSASEYLKDDNIFVYCDFSRFGPEGKDCNGNDIAPRASDKKPFKCNRNLNRLAVSSDLSSKCENQDPDADGRTDVRSLL